MSTPPFFPSPSPSQLHLVNAAAALALAHQAVIGENGFKRLLRHVHLEHVWCTPHRRPFRISVSISSLPLLAITHTHTELNPQCRVIVLIFFYLGCRVCCLYKSLIISKRIGQRMGIGQRHSYVSLSLSLASHTSSLVGTSLSSLYYLFPLLSPFFPSNGPIVSAELLT